MWKTFLSRECDIVRFTVGKQRYRLYVEMSGDGMWRLGKDSRDSNGLQNQFPTHTKSIYHTTL
jgi:hypothetical protein